MKKLFKEFAAFVNKGNALSLAIGVIIGGAFTAIVTAINKQIISPLLGWLLGGYNLAESESLKTVLKSAVLDETTGEIIQAENAIYWGALIQAVIDFLLIAVILFIIFKVVTNFVKAARMAAERIHDKITDDEEEVVEEVVVEEPKPSDEVLLLTEIRDLLSKKDNSNE